MSTFSNGDPTSFRPAPPGEDSDPSLSLASQKSVNYSAVPRRPNSSKESMDNTKYEDMIAPLGFEPEGSATKPSFCEGNSSLSDLLSDRHGFNMFREYLLVQKQESLVDFWKSCEDFKSLANTGSNLATPKANSTYNNYMHSKHLCAEVLQDAVRAKVKHTLSSGQPLKETLFDNAKDDILSYLDELHYGRFLGSDICKRSDVSKAMHGKDRVTARNSSRFVGTALPPLLEEKVFDPSQTTWTAYDVNTRSHGRTVDEDRDGYVPINLNLSKAALAGMYRQPGPPVGSVDHSDVQSLSSDAQTDDTKSTVTDLSDLTAKTNGRKTRPGFQDVPGFIPRTKKLPKARKQLPPEEFAKILIEKLEKVVLKREQEERTAVNLAGLPHEHVRESKKSILEDAAERHHQFQQAGRFGLALPPPKFQEPCYPVASNTMPYLHPGYIEQQGITGYYPAIEPAASSNSSWRAACQPDVHVLEKRQCASLMNTKKHWESVGTIESAPDSGVCVEENLSLPLEARNRILQWMEHSEKETPQDAQGNNYNKSSRTSYNKVGQPGTMPHGTMLIQPGAQDLMPPLTQPDSRNTIEEVSRRLSQKNVGDKRSKSHKNRTGYLSNKASQGACPTFSGESGDCSSSTDMYNQAAMYSSSSVLSSVPSTVNSKDSGFGACALKNKRIRQGTRIVYYLDGEKYPYQSNLPDKEVVLKQFKELIPFKKGNYRYFFKTKTDEEDCEAVYEEIIDDHAILPCYDGNKVICKVKESKHV